MSQYWHCTRTSSCGRVRDVCTKQSMNCSGYPACWPRASLTIWALGVSRLLKLYRRVNTNDGFFFYSTSARIPAPPSSLILLPHRSRVKSLAHCPSTPASLPAREEPAKRRRRGSGYAVFIGVIGASRTQSWGQPIHNARTSVTSWCTSVFPVFI